MIPKKKTLKEFRIEADAVFHAVDIDDAMKVLGTYFVRLARDGLETKSIFSSGRVDILSNSESRIRT